MIIIIISIILKVCLYILSYVNHFLSFSCTFLFLKILSCFVLFFLTACTPCYIHEQIFNVFFTSFYLFFQFNWI
jgi:hypothetical protein